MATMQLTPLKALPCKDGLMDESAFPPADLKAFLTLCAGRWMSLRSRFELDGTDEDWHASERGELTVTLEEQDAASVLAAQAGEGVASELRFASDSATEGGLVVRAEGAERSCRWQLTIDDVCVWHPEQHQML